MKKLEILLQFLTRFVINIVLKFFKSDEIVFADAETINWLFRFIGVSSRQLELASVGIIKVTYLRLMSKASRIRID